MRLFFVNNNYSRKIILPISCIIFLIATFFGCKENEFPISPLPEEFEMIPPSDVSLLRATAADAKVILYWGAPPETNIVSIEVKNLNDGIEKKLEGNAREVEMTGLTNFESYEFLVKTVNDKGLISYGATVKAIPFSMDNVKPAPVTDLLGFKLDESSVMATWKNPVDEDLAGIIVYLGGNDSVSVDRESTYAIISGPVNEKVRVYAVDFSGNYSDINETTADKSMVTIKGSDDGNDETLRMILNPAVTIIDEFVVFWADNKEMRTTATDPVFIIPMGDLGPTSVWKAPVRVGLISQGVLVTEYEYYPYNDIAGTIRATFYDRSEGNINIEGDMRNIGSLGDGTTTWYNVQISESGTYGVTAYCARPDGTARYQIYIDDVAISSPGEVYGTGGWSNFTPWDGPQDLQFEEGNHTLKIVFLNGGANYEKFLFKKIN
jgi:hypothetical protein